VYYGGVAAAPVTRATLEAALAARSTPLDKRAMAVASPPPFGATLLGQSSGERAQPNRAAQGQFVFAINASPPKRASQPQPLYALPDVTGLPMRDAVRQLHASGYRVRVAGNGIVRAIGAPTGNVVRITATEAAR
jgi:cell division protein FtsI (penicillin-binding protein 3)